MDPQRLRVLLVDDNAHVARALARAARWSRVDVVVATGMLSLDRVDVVVADVSLRDRHGLALLDDVAAVAPRVGRVLCGAAVHRELIDSALRRGRIHTFLEKPFSVDDLVAAAAVAAARGGVVDVGGHALAVH